MNFADRVAPVAFCRQRPRLEARLANGSGLPETIVMAEVEGRNRAIHACDANPPGLPTAAGDGGPMPHGCGDRREAAKAAQAVSVVPLAVLVAAGLPAVRGSLQEESASRQRSGTDPGRFRAPAPNVRDRAVRAEGCRT